MHTKFHRRRKIILAQNKPGNNESQFTDTNSSNKNHEEITKTEINIPKIPEYGMIN